jgi:hypothetical protein
MVYDYLVDSTKNNGRRVHIDSEKGVITRSSTPRHLAVSQTCRGIHAEFFRHLYLTTVFTITVQPSNAFVGASQVRRPVLPKQSLCLDMICKIRVLAYIGGVDGGSFFDIAAIIEKTPNLQTFSVAFKFPERLHIRRDNAHLWSNSAVLQGMICHTIQAVPKHVQLNWWYDSESNNEWINNYLTRWPYVPVDVLSDMARMYEPLRGSLYKRVA